MKTQFQSYSSASALSEVGAQHQHTGLAQAFLAIGREQGFRGYFRGLTSFLPRVCVYSGTQLATYDGVKGFVMSTGGAGDNFATHLVCSVVTTWAAVTMLCVHSLPPATPPRTLEDPGLNTRRDRVVQLEPETAFGVHRQPFDFLAVRQMNQLSDEHGRPLQYRNAADCAVQTLRTEGVAGFFKGAMANYARFTPYGILQLVLIEQFKRLAAAMRGDE